MTNQKITMHHFAIQLIKKFFTDSQIQELPIDKSIWILGWENRFKSRFFATLKNSPAKFVNNKLFFFGKKLTRKKHSIAVSGRNPLNLDLGLAWIAIGNSKGVSGFSNKLPHYHKYSYLAFEGEEMINILKGKWAVLNSPMTIFFSQKRTTQLIRGKLLSRKALAYLP